MVVTDKDREVMLELAKISRSIKARMLARYPDALFADDPCKGMTFLEIDCRHRTDDLSLIVMIHLNKPLGLCTKPLPEVGYGEGPDETYETEDLLFNRIVELLENP